MIARENKSRPLYVIAHSMGCLVTAIGLSRHPSLVTRVVFSAPMIRNKCGIKYFDYKIHIPQPLTYFSTYCSCYFGFSTTHALGFFKEKSTDKITIKLTTDKLLHINYLTKIYNIFCNCIYCCCRRQLENYINLRQRYPSIISSCATNGWILHTLRAQYKFALKYQIYKPNTLILMASDDVFVYNRAISYFANKAQACRLIKYTSNYICLYFMHVVSVI